MSTNSGVNAGFAKCFIVFMAVVILIQGCGYLGLSIWGLTMERCSEQATDISKNPFGFAIDLIYLATEDCGNLTVTIQGAPATIAIGMDWTKSFEITNRMFIFMITYAVVSALWIVTSLLIIVTICSAVTKTILGVCYWPWFLLIIAGSILDVVATGYYIHDIVHTTTANDTFAYVGAIIDSEVQTLFKNFDPYFVTPAIVMTCISSRVVLIWLLNIFGSSFCLSLSRVLAKRNSSSSKRDNLSPSNTSTVCRDSPAHLPAQQQAQRQILLQAQTKEQYSPPQIKPKPLPVQAATAMQQSQQAFNQNQQIQRRSYEPAPLTSPQYAHGIKAPTPEANVSNTTQAHDLNRQTSENIEIMTYRNTDTHPDRLDYPSTPASPTPPPLSDDVQRSTSQLSASSPLNNRYATAEPPFQIQYQNQSQPPRVSAELRSQLPWSYTSMQAKPPPPPRKPQVQVYPEVPEPDYTVHSDR